MKTRLSYISIILILATIPMEMLATGKDKKEVGSQCPSFGTPDCQEMFIPGCEDEEACDYTPLTAEGNDCCYEVCTDVNMFDFAENGWNGASYTISDASDDEVIASGDIDTAEQGDGLGNGIDALCLEDGCYYIEVGGGDNDEQIAWVLLGVNGVVTGGATEFPTYFSVGDAECYSCQEPLACNFNLDAIFSDCTLCEYSTCLGCTLDNAANYNPLATLDDGSCIFDLIDPCPFDTDDNGLIDTLDLLAFLGVFGTICP